MGFSIFAWAWKPRREEPLIEPVSKETMVSEVRRLGHDQILLEQGPFQVLAVSPRQVPAMLLEIGRLREVTFRQIGEGTGAAVDLDRFDEHYQQLILWNRERQEIVGAYRLAVVDQTVRQYGSSALYTASLFHLSNAFFEELGPAVELGRSFIRAEYQRRPHTLLFLWRGIGRYLERFPRHRTLFGPVSISARYSLQSRSAIAEYLDRSTPDEPLRRHVKPRRRFRSAASGVQREEVLTVEALDQLVRSTGVEPDSRGIPVLLRHYLGLGGRALAVSVDPSFGGCLDALVVVDLRMTETRLLDKILGWPTASAHAQRASRGPFRRTECDGPIDLVKV